MKMKMWASLLLAALILGACSAPPAAVDPPDNLADEIIFEDEEPSENDESEAEEMIFEEEDVADEAPSDEALEFSDEEGTQIYLESIPPGGQWSVTHMEGEMICPEGVVLLIPAEPPVVGTIFMSDDGKTMSFPYEAGTVTLTQTLVASDGELRTSFYEGSLFVDGQELKYYMEYNLLGNGQIFGVINFTFEECIAERPLEAVYLNP